jgi:hypothetical protein
MYDELFNLNKGLRLMDFNLYSEAAEGASTFADTWSVAASGLGGDPFPTAQLTVAKKKAYDLRATWRQSYYHWNQNDNVILPIAPLVGMTTGLTTNHDWDTVRKFGSLDFTVHATNNLRFNFSLYHTSENGTTLTTRSLDFVDSPSFWGTFARANPYMLDAPVRDDTDRITGGIDYTLKSWNFHYNLGYQTFTENISLDNVTSPELSINPVASSKREPVTFLSWSQYRRLDTPVSEFSYNGKPSKESKWELRGGYIFYRYQGPATLNESFNGVAPNASGALAPYSVSQSARDNLTESSHIIDQGFTYQIRPWADFEADYRYSRDINNAAGVLTSLFNAVTPGTGGDTTAWHDGISYLDLNLRFAPLPSLIVEPGVRLIKADIESITDGVVAPATTLRTKTAAPELRASFQPSRKFSIRGDMQHTVNGSSYTAITPHTQSGGHVRVRYQPTRTLTLDNDTRIVSSTLLETNYASRIRSNGTVLTYAPQERLSVFAGFTYDSLFAEGNIVYARGTPPLNDFLRDQAVNRVIQGGIEAGPFHHFGLRVSGNYDRTTGVGQISGEPPAYGPIRWPLITGTVYCDFPKAGRLSLDLFRSFYTEQIVPGNNFGANTLAIRWTKGL